MQSVAQILLVAVLIGIFGYGAYDNYQMTDKDPLVYSTPTSVNLPQNTPNQSPTQTPFSTSNPTPLQTEFTLKDLIYTDAEITKQYPNTIFMNTSADVSIVTNWYEDKISEYGFNAASVIRTNTNNQVLNKIAAANSDYEIMIEITNAGNETSVKISLD